MNESNGIVWGTTRRSCRISTLGEMQVLEVELFSTMEGDRKKVLMLKSKDSVRKIEREVEEMSLHEVSKYLEESNRCYVTETP